MDSGSRTRLRRRGSKWFSRQSASPVPPRSRLSFYAAPRPDQFREIEQAFRRPRPSRERERPAHHHEIIVCGPPIVRHDRLIMQTKEAKTIACEGLRPHHIVDLHPSNDGLPLNLVLRYPLQGSRIELVEADRVVARMVFCPKDIFRLQHVLDGAAHPDGARMQGTLGNSGADRQDAYAGSVPSQSGIQAQGARDDVDREHGPKTVADDNDFIRFTGACCRDKPFREPFESRLEILAPTMNIVIGENPVVESLMQPPTVSRPTQEQRKQRQPDNNPPDKSNF